MAMSSDTDLVLFVRRSGVSTFKIVFFIKKTIEKSKFSQNQIYIYIYIASPDFDFQVGFAIVTAREYIILTIDTHFLLALAAAHA
jgi:hypothetical protein